MNCPECGVEVMEGAGFCHKCGATIAPAQDPTPQSSTPQPSANPGNEPSRAGGEEQRRTNDPSAAERFQAARSARQVPDDDQEVDLWEGNYSSKAMVGTWIGAGVLTIVALVAGVLLQFTATGWWITVAAIVILWIGVFLWLLYRQHSVHYRLTNQRLIHQKGLLSRVTDRIEVIDIDDITFSQGVIERMLDVGTITITSSDRTHPEMKLPGIDDVRGVFTLMDDARRKERRKRGLHIESV